MSLYTKANLRDQTLTALGVLDPTETADADTIARVDPIIQQMLENLNDENALNFDPSTETDEAIIPGRVMLPLKELAEYELGPSYGRPKTVQDRELSLRRLRRSTHQGTDPIPVVIENF